MTRAPEDFLSFVTDGVEMTEQLPVTIWQGTFTLFGVEVHCSLLDNGERVFDADDVARLFIEMARRDRDCPPGDIEAFWKWQRGDDAR